MQSQTSDCCSVLHQRVHGHRRTAGAIVGQVAIPVPVLGDMVGGFVGVIAGKGLGNLEGRGVALLINDKETDLPVIIHCIFVSMDSKYFD